MTLLVLVSVILQADLECRDFFSQNYSSQSQGRDDDIEHKTTHFEGYLRSNPGADPLAVIFSVVVPLSVPPMRMRLLLLVLQLV